MSEVIDEFILGAETNEALAKISEDKASFEGTPEDYDEVLGQLYEVHKKRFIASGQVPAYALPQLPDSEAQEVYERIIDAERTYASPSLTKDDYLLGSATVENELFTIDGTGALITAEHATVQQRIQSDGTRSAKEPDWGVAGLGYVLSEDINTGLIIARGRQTGDANNDPEHPLRDKLGKMIATGSYVTTAALHGMRRAYFDTVLDERGFDIFVGIGEEDEMRVRAAEIIGKHATELGLRVGINQAFTTMGPQSDYRPKYKADGSSFARDRFAAKKPETTRSFAQQALEQNGQLGRSLQIELSSLLRLGPVDGPRMSDKGREVAGVYAGYEVLARSLAEIALLQTPEL
jgi:hypothetical protein